MKRPSSSIRGVSLVRCVHFCTGFYLLTFSSADDTCEAMSMTSDLADDESEVAGGGSADSDGDEEGSASAVNAARVTKPSPSQGKGKARRRSKTTKSAEYVRSDSDEEPDEDNAAESDRNEVDNSEKTRPNKSVGVRLSQYEHERADRIKQNHALLEGLGVKKAAAAAFGTSSASNGVKKTGATNRDAKGKENGTTVAVPRATRYVAI